MGVIAGEKTERRDEVDAQSRSIPRQGRCTLARNVPRRMSA